MTAEAAVIEQLAAFEAATNTEFRWRTTLVSAVLHVSRPSIVRTAFAKVDPSFTPDDRTLRAMLARTRSAMGLPPLPTGAGGRPSEATYQAYREEHCAKWIRDNGGPPRVHQLVDPLWDLKPSPESSKKAEENNRETSIELAGNHQDVAVELTENRQDNVKNTPENQQKTATEITESSPVARTSETGCRSKGGAELSMPGGDPIAERPDKAEEVRQLDNEIENLSVTPDFPETLVRLKNRQFFLQHGEEMTPDQIRDLYPAIGREMADAGLPWAPPV